MPTYSGQLGGSDGPQNLPPMAPAPGPYNAPQPPSNAGLAAAIAAAFSGGQVGSGTTPPQYQPPPPQAQPPPAPPLSPGAPPFNPFGPTPPPPSFFDFLFNQYGLPRNPHTQALLWRLMAG